MSKLPIERGIEQEEGEWWKGMFFKQILVYVF